MSRCAVCALCVSRAIAVQTLTVLPGRDTYGIRMPLRPGVLRRSLNVYLQLLRMKSLEFRPRLPQYSKTKALTELEYSFTYSTYWF